MRFKITIQRPFPGYIAERHAGFGDFEFGVFRWVYDGFADAVEVINAEQWCSTPRYPHPTTFKLWLAPRVRAIYDAKFLLRTDLPAVKAFDGYFNPATGEGMPFNIP